MASESLINQLSQPFYNADGTPNDRLDKYCSQEVQKIVIRGNEFTGYKTYSFFWEKAYVKEPERSASGVISNLNSYATFITPHLQIKFSLMSMEDYRRLYDLILSANEFLVTCYNPLTNETTTNNMYFYPDSLPKLNMMARKVFNGEQKEKWVELLGVEDYTIEMVGTNTQLGGLTVTYMPNVPSGVSSSLTGVTVNVANGEQILVGKNAETIMNTTLTASNGTRYVFKKWCTVAKPVSTNKGLMYAQDEDLVIKENTTLYAQWGTIDTYTLSYDYGLGEAKVDSYGNAITTKEVKKNTQFGTLYRSSNPTVTFDGNNYTNAYYWAGWFRNSQGVGQAIKASDTYGVDGNTTIYQVFKPNGFQLQFNSNGGTTISSISADYNSTIAIPVPKKEGKTFGGWYYDTKFTKPFGGKMPPVSKTLYAKWE